MTDYGALLIGQITERILPLYERGRKGDFDFKYL
jgi:hypothetical protein